jgi:hypothetical protein
MTNTRYNLVPFSFLQVKINHMMSANHVPILELSAASNIYNRTYFPYYAPYTSTLIYRSESQSSIGLLLTSIKLTYKSYTFFKSIFPLCILRSRDRQREGETRRRGKTKGGDRGRGAESHEGDSEGRGDR